MIVFGTPFQDDDHLIAKRQDLFGKRLYAHAQVQNNKTGQTGKSLDDRLVIGNLIDQMHIAGTV